METLEESTASRDDSNSLSPTTDTTEEVAPTGDSFDNDTTEMVPSNKESEVTEETDQPVDTVIKVKEEVDDSVDPVEVNNELNNQEVEQNHEKADQELEAEESQKEETLIDKNGEADIKSETNNEDDKPEKAENGDEDDDTSDEEDIQITIGDISDSYGPVNFNIQKNWPQVSATKSKSTKLDLDAVGEYQGEAIYDLNIDILDDKPWRKPGADITDYFNYGFTEETWKLYCEKQKRLRSEALTVNTVETPLPSSPTSSTKPIPGKSDMPIPVASVNENSKYSALGVQKKAGPPPGRKASGKIDVIGGGTPSTPSVITSRRPQEMDSSLIDNMPANFMPVFPPIPHPGHGPPPPFHLPPGPPPPIFIPPPASMPFFGSTAPIGYPPEVKASSREKDSKERHNEEYPFIKGEPPKKDKRDRDRDRERDDKRDRDRDDKRDRERDDKRDRDRDDKRDRTRDDKRDRERDSKRSRESRDDKKGRSCERKKRRY